MVRTEPASMTLVDLMALVAGVGIGWAILASLPVLAFNPPPEFALVLLVVAFFRASTIAISIVVLARVVVYRRMPHPAEWLALLLSASVLSARPEFDIDQWINIILSTFPMIGDLFTFDGWRWLVAGLITWAILVGIASLRPGRRLFPPWLKAVLLAGLGLLAVSGPLEVFSLLGDDLISPSEGFGAGSAAILHRQACGLFAHLPLGLLFGVPAIAALVERIRGRSWGWTEWASMSSSTMVGFSMMMLRRGEFANPSPAWLAERLLILAWFLAVGLLSRLIVVRFAGPWRSWIAGPEHADAAPRVG